ncbi:unnamed protein product [Microthlaspi erraticum]|uniref:Uncharacterized protein n=1 Tax=Microthlaspi erraticum TaxID=1685480 RepID=A0A6D2J6Q7_9BRAS|nr:unnamed protein product [Microthlaspi erraticum]
MAIWMSRKGVIAKRVKTAPDGSIEKSAPNRADRLAEERMLRSAKTVFVRLKSRPKSKPLGRSHSTTRETFPRSAKPNVTPHRTTKAREPGNKPRGRATHLACHGRCIRPSRERTSHVRPRILIGQISIRSTTPADRETVRPRPFRLAHDPTVRPIVPHDRPNAAVDPKPFLKPKLMFSSPA